MIRTFVTGMLAAVLAFAATDSAARSAEQAGQADLDEAIALKVTAESLADLDQVIEKCESAIKQGLDADNDKFARNLLSATLYQIASRLCEPIFDQRPPNPSWPLLRQQALPRLEKLVKYDDQMSEAYYLIARLQSLPGGDPKQAAAAVAAAVKLAGSVAPKLSKALLLRGELAEDKERKLADFNQAVIIDPKNAEALKTRGLFYLGEGETEKATADFAKLLELNDDDLTAHHALAEALTGAEKYDEALEHLKKAEKIDPSSPLTFTLRARIHVLQGDLPAGIADLDAALNADPNDVPSMLMRARIYQVQDKLDEAKKDVEHALLLRPGLIQAILLRSMIAASEENYDTAVADMQTLLESDPKNIEWRIQLAAYYNAGKRPRRSIETLNAVLEDDPQNTLALHGRADALLSVGKHAEAIADYNEVLKLEPDNSGVLNNLAWVLATSPKDKLRNGKRSVELGTKACELTEYKKAHILSTLAAGYAETGDFETARKWSSKAVELGDDEVLDQLKQELESYKQEKPWRELQKIEEPAEPTRGGGNFEL